MNLRMSISPPSEPLHLVPEFDLSADYESLVMDVCELLSEAGCEFKVQGFGQRDWPVDVSYDLSTVMEQLPEVTAALEKDQRAAIDLYGQGVERGLTFDPSGDLVAIRCSSRTDWTPEPDTELAPRGEVIRLFAGLASDFKTALEYTCPSVAEVRPFTDW